MTRLRFCAARSLTLITRGPVVIVVDTDPLLFYVNGSAELPRKSRRFMTRYMRGAGVVLISPMTLVEIAELAQRKYLALTIPVDEWLSTLMSVPAIRVADIDHEVAFESANLPGPVPDKQTDRLIMALARVRDLDLVTNNPTMLANEHVRTVWD